MKILNKFRTFIKKKKKNKLPRSVRFSDINFHFDFQSDVDFDVNINYYAIFI